MPGVVGGSTAWGDYDNDGDLDILMTGFYYGDNYVQHYIANIYRNDGNGVYTDINAGLIGVDGGSARWGDYNNDGYLDILLTGGNDSEVFAKVYRNNGNGTFTDINASLIDVAGPVAWGDYDNDGYLDILLTGSNVSGAIAKVYRNNGNGSFTDINAGLIGVAAGSVAWGDYDNDGDLDILLTGCLSGGNSNISKVYRNDGNGTFTDINAGLTGVVWSSSAWGDYNNDGYLDILLTGHNNAAINVSKVYRNNGDGTFTDINADLTGVGESGSSSAWGDFDNDGHLDILLTGGATGYSRSIITKVYRNNGNGAFVDINADLVGVSMGSVAWGDYDNDGDLDILLTGVNQSGYISKIYRNDCTIVNSAPSAPSNLRANVVGDFVEFQWDASYDVQTPALGLNYVLRIGTTPEGNQISSSMANSSGYRLIPIRGYANSTCTWKVLASSLTTQFYWSVQAIDGAYAGSPFSVEQYMNSLPSGIQVLSPMTLNFGNIFDLYPSSWFEIRIRNTGQSDLTVSNLHFCNSSSKFNFNYTHLGVPILPGDIDTIGVRFAPTSIGIIRDTLYIVSNADNMPVAKISLSGTGIYVPPTPPGNIRLVMNGNNAVISWDAVTQTIFNTPIVPDYYLIFFNGARDINDDYYYLGWSESLSYTHQRVGLHSPNMFYRVIAYKDFTGGRAERVLNSLSRDKTEAEALHLLDFP